MVLVGAVSAATNTVIDLSHYNGNVDLKKAWDDGIRTIIHKATQGTKYVDPKYSTNKAAAEKLGFVWAAYHFADGSNGTVQADHFVKTAGNVRRYVIDLEDNPKGTTVGKQQAEEMVKAMEKKTGQTPIVYGNAYFLDSLNSKILRSCPLWIASYRSSSPRMPKNWSAWLMWQYTDGKLGMEPHTVKGIGKVDRSFLQPPSL
ncbi:Zn_pept [Nesidiocoris tenuis]|nr:Zn_pept [Nesidiocoris tenuis]